MGKIDYIATAVDRLVRKYRTRDPFELCAALKIEIRYKNCENLLKAYFVSISRIKSIVINNQTTEAITRILVAHESGHAVLHSEIAMLRGFQEFELFDIVSPMEYEANLFAAELLIDDEELMDLLNNSEKSFFGVARELCVPAELLDFKFRVLKNKGYHIEPPMFAQGDFMKEDMGEMYY